MSRPTQKLGYIVSPGYSLTILEFPDFLVFHVFQVSAVTLIYYLS